MPSVRTVPRQTIGAAPATAVYLFQPQPEDAAEFGGAFGFCGWLLTLSVTNADPAARPQVTFRAWDGLPQATRDDAWELEQADLRERTTRVFLPWSAVEVTFANAGANNITVQARGVVVGVNGAWPAARYLTNGGTQIAAAGGGAFDQFQVPDGATHYRVRWTQAVGAFTVQDRASLGGAALSEYNLSTGNVQARRWIPLNPIEVPGGDRQVAVAFGGAPGPSVAVEFLYDLAGDHR